MRVRERGLLLLAVLLVLLSLWKLLWPGRAEALREELETVFFPDSREKVEAWGRLFADEGELIAASGPGERR